MSDSSDPPSSEPSRRRQMTPLIQANFVAGFTGSFAAVYGALARVHDPLSYPPNVYWIVFSLAYFLFYFSFYIDPLNKLYAWVAEQLSGLGELLGGHVSGSGASTASQTASVVTAGRFPLQDSLRVQLLSISAIALAGWLTVYSGGPFLSPYGQVLLALPLLSPTIARDNRSIMAVYAATAVAALAFHMLREEHTPAAEWYITTTYGVLGVSFLLVWLTTFANRRS